MRRADAMRFDRLELMPMAERDSGKRAHGERQLCWVHIIQPKATASRLPDDEST